MLSRNIEVGSVQAGADKMGGAAVRGGLLIVVEQCSRCLFTCCCLHRLRIHVLLSSRRPLLLRVPGTITE